MIIFGLNEKLIFIFENNYLLISSPRNPWKIIMLIVKTNQTKLY